MLKGKVVLVTCPACYGKWVKDCKKCKGKGVIVNPKRSI